MSETIRLFFIALIIAGFLFAVIEGCICSYRNEEPNYGWWAVVSFGVAIGVTIGSVS